MKKQGVKHIKGMQRGQGGFTLIELLIVVAIIGVLAAIAVPQYTAYRDSAAESACEQELSAAKTPIQSGAVSATSDLDWSACNSAPTLNAATSSAAGSLVGEYTVPSTGNPASVSVSLGREVSL